MNGPVRAIDGMIVGRIQLPTYLRSDSQMDEFPGFSVYCGWLDRTSREEETRLFLHRNTMNELIPRSHERRNYCIIFTICRTLINILKSRRVSSSVWLLISCLNRKALLRGLSCQLV